MIRDRKGFTLIELIVVTVLSSLVVGAVLGTLTANQRTYTALNATIAGQQTTRMTVEVLFAELREISAAGGDILAMTSDSLRVRLMRKFSVVCETNWTGQPQLTVIRLGIGSNAFATGDSVFVYADNDESDENDDAWISARITAVDTSGVTCPQTGGPGDRLRFNGQTALFSADSVGLGAPVRSYKRYTFATSTLLGDTYFSRREGSGDMVPISGPLRVSGGLQFVYRDALGAVTAVDTLVRQIEVTIHTGSNVLNSLGGTVSDSITAWIYTRN